jgi:hypothetical protein
MKLWKVLGVAGLAGVAATGVIMARDHRRRSQLEPEEIRNRLHQRLEQAESRDRESPEAGSNHPDGRPKDRGRRR